MTRTVSLLFSVWTAFFAPAAAITCSETVPGGLAPTGKEPQDGVVKKRSYLALGDSYTIGTSIASTGSYPLQTVSMLNRDSISFSDPVIIAANGWTTGDLMSALNEHFDRNNKTTYDMVTLLIGVNNQYQGGSVSDYEPEFASLLQKSIMLAGDKPSHVVVISIPDYSVSPFGTSRNRSGIAAGIDAYNKANKAIAAARGVQYLDVTTFSRKAEGNPALFAGDGLHYSPEEYALWAKALAGVFKADITE